jgi:hypothetical protein
MYASRSKCDVFIDFIVPASQQCLWVAAILLLNFPRLLL